MSSAFAPSRSFLRRAKDVLRYRLFRQNWNIGVVPAPIAIVAGLEGRSAQANALGKTIWMPEERGLFRADPFPLPRGDGGIDIFFEQLRWSENRGTIEQTTFDGLHFGPIRRALRLNHHLSYPYTIKDGGEWHVLPEQAEGRTLTRYPIPFDAEAGRIIIEDEALLDASIFKNDGLYWMFATRPGRQENVALFLYRSDDLDGPWTRVGDGPVKSDAASGRPAGHVFQYQGEWYRPGQNCARYYGESIAVHRILEMSTDSYSEERVAEVRPIPGSRYRDGLHTLSACGDWTIVDGARLESTLLPALDRLAILVR